MKEFKLPNLDNEKTVLKTIRLKLATLNKVEELSNETNISVNRLINECIEFALENLNKEGLKKKISLLLIVHVNKVCYN